MGWRDVVGMLSAIVFAALILFGPLYANGYYAKYSGQDHAQKETIDISAAERTAEYTLWLTVFTGALVICTGLLFWATWRQGKASELAALAAKKSADVAAGVQGPRFPAIAITMSENGVAGALTARHMTIRMVNQGLTTAETVDWTVDYRISDALPIVPAYPDPWAPPIVEAIATNKAWEIRLTPDDLDYSDEEIVRVVHRQSTFWVFGCFRYRDFLGTLIVQGFSKRMRPIPQPIGALHYDFIDDGGAAYIYRHYEPAN